MPARIEFEEFRQGWPTLSAAALGNATGVGAIMYYSVSSFMLPLEDTFGWTRSEMGLAVSVLVLGWIISMPLVGLVCDKVGPRKPVLVSIPLLALTLVALSQLNGALWHLYGLFFAGAVFGSGTLGVTYIAAVSARFVENRGLAYGITLAGTGISAFLLPLGLHQLITLFDWRTAWMVLALCALVQWPIAYVYIRPPTSAQQGTSSSTGPNALWGDTLADALRSTRFWLLAVAFLLIATLLSGLLINLIPLLSEAGMTREEAASATAGIGVGLLFARVFVGYLLDRVSARWVAVVAFSIAAFGCWLLDTGDPVLAGVGALALGFTVGSELDLLAYMTARYFGNRAHASIYAVSLSVFYVGAVIAPLLVGQLHEQSQGYSVALQATVVVCAIASVLIIMMGPYPSRPAAHSLSMS